MKNLVNEEVKPGIEERELVLELMHDMIERILTPRELKIYIMSKRMKPRYIAIELGIKSQSVRVDIARIKKKINNHEKWLKDKVKLRGLVI